MTISTAKDSDSSTMSDRFQVIPNTFTFHRQYSEIYCARFQQGKPLLVEACSRKWNAVSGTDTTGNSKRPRIRPVADLVMDEKCVIIGTIYKEMKLKPSILRDLAAADSSNVGIHLAHLDEAFKERLISADDCVYLEDDVQRIALVFNEERIKKILSPTRLATGVLIALLGSEPKQDRGSFYVEDALFLQPQPQHPICRFPSTVGISPAECTQFRTTGPWLALVSGLGFMGDGPVRPGHEMALQLMADWFRCAGDFSQAGGGDDGPGIIRLMILGDSIHIPTVPKDKNSVTMRLAQQARYLTRNTEAATVTAMSRLDTWLSSLPISSQRTLDNAADYDGLAIDLLPGPLDPTSSLLPQVPLHPSIFPASVARSGDLGHGGLVGRTNPYICHVANRTVLATSGQGINDLELYTDLKEPCDRMEATLLWGHLAPTCPDTLPGYPVTSTDPLLLRSNGSASPDYPDIYAAGCQPGENASWRRASLHWPPDSEDEEPNGALLVAVPRFCVSHSFVLVHLETLDCRVVHFDSGLSDEIDED
ncbi:unnamed protein product [Calicophoron daubneyi]|uniref:DNA polymerase delta small subunit n=1 Tax=Calicophoron daubneyi TaxID=300641 RepID=A0AAV2TYN3_CALDB